MTSTTSVKPWRIIREYKKGRLIEVWTLCGDCFESPDAHKYTAETDGYKVELKTLTPCADDSCHNCQRSPEAVV